MFIILENKKSMNYAFFAGLPRFIIHHRADKTLNPPEDRAMAIQTIAVIEENLICCKKLVLCLTKHSFTFVTSHITIPDPAEDEKVPDAQFASSQCGIEAIPEQKQANIHKGINNNTVCHVLME